VLTESIAPSVAPSVAVSATQTGAPLPRTGANTRGLVLIGLGFVLLGAGAVQIRRSEAPI
jgi:LPXTG-motif cell wall-anchored protein